MTKMTLRRLIRLGLPSGLLTVLGHGAQALGAAASCALWVGVAMPGMQLLPGVSGSSIGNIAISLQSALLGIDDSGKPARNDIRAAAQALGLVPIHLSPTVLSAAPKAHPSTRHSRFVANVPSTTPTPPHATTSPPQAFEPQPASSTPQAPTAQPAPAPTPTPTPSASPALLAQTIQFTSDAPTNATVGGATYGVGASADSGLPVTLGIDSSSASVCTLSGSTVSFTGAGTCTLDATQPGNAQYGPASPVSQSVDVGRGAQSITFTSTAPSNATYHGATYSVAASSDDGLPVSFGVDPASSATCTVSGSTVGFTGVGTCTIDADQPGNANYVQAQTQQSFSVGKAAQGIAFTSSAPADAAVGGATYSAAATADSGLTVSLSVDGASSGVCSLSGSTVSFIAVGTCTIDADQPGDGNHTAAPQAQQTFAVAKGAQSISFTSNAPAGAAYRGPAYTVGANADSGLPVSLGVEPSSASVCSLSGSIVTFIGAGTCTIDADQAGNANYNAALQAQQSFSVGKAQQTITFSSTAPTNATVAGATYTATASSDSGLPVALAIDAASSAVCSLSGSTVSFTAAGTCTVDADQAGNANYEAASRTLQSIIVGKGTQTISFTSTAPSNAVYNGATYTVAATSSAGLPVSFSIDASSTTVCSLSGSAVSFTGVGTCKVDADQAGDANYSAAAEVVQAFSVAKASQAIAFTTTAPAGAKVGGASYSAAATADSGLLVTLSVDAASAGICSLSGSNVSFTGAGTCTIDANQAGDANYTAAPEAQQSFSVAKGDQTVSFTSTAPANAKVAGASYSVAASSDAGLAVSLSIDAASTSVCTLTGSTVSFVGAGTCAVDANQAGNANYNAAAQAQQTFTVGKGDQTITFTSTAPANAKVAGSSYVVAASSDAGLAVSFSVDAASTSVCGLSGSTVSFTAVGSCTIGANQPGNANYNAAVQAQQTFTVGKGDQAISFTSTAPSNAVYHGATYTVAASSSSGLPVSFSIDATSTSVCSLAGATVSFIGVGTCTIDADQAGNANYNAAAEVLQAFTVGKASQTVTFTSTAPANAVYNGSTYTVAASADSGLAVSLSIDATSTSVCSLAGATVSFTGVGTCTIDADQAGNANYNAATRAQQTFSVGKAPQTVSFTSTAPANAKVGGSTYSVAATANSGLTVAITIDAASSSVCSLSGATVSFAGVGTCTIDANQAGNANYNAGAQAQQSFSVSKGTQTITFTSTAPSNAVYNGPTYAVAATADSGLAVSFSIDATSTSVCSLSGSTVSFIGAGTCTIDANQAGNASYNAAAQVIQAFSVAGASQTITFTSTPPAMPKVKGTYDVAASSDSGLPVTISIDATSSSICSLSGSKVTFNDVGTCTIDANQAGNAYYNPAPEAEQTMSVGKGTQAITFTTTAPSNAVYNGPSYTVAASSDSGLPVALTIDATSSSVCTLSGSAVSFIGVGTCTIDANQAGGMKFKPAPQVQQSFSVGQAPQTIVITSTAPSNAVYQGATYTVAATASSGLTVAIAVDATSSSVCSLTGSTVSFIGVGTCTLDANQAGNSDYAAASQVQQTFSVGQATPSVSWSNPADIVYGTGLGATQLDATASVPGAFVYTPLPGTVLSPGTQTLSVTFNPTDSTDYASASGSVQINVTFSEPCITSDAGAQSIGSGQAICVTTGGTIHGTQISAGGALWVDGGTVAGPIDATSPSAITLCNTSVNGHLFIDQASGPVEIGGPGCAGITVAASTQITNGTGGLSFVGNNVTSWITITNNTGGYTFSGNSAGGTITTTGNS